MDSYVNLSELHPTKSAAFVESRMEDLVSEFVSFARTLEPTYLGNTVAELRDHARDIAAGIAAGLDEVENYKEKG